MILVTNLLFACHLLSTLQLFVSQDHHVCTASTPTFSHHNVTF